MRNGRKERKEDRLKVGEMGRGKRRENKKGKEERRGRKQGKR